MLIAFGATTIAKCRAAKVARCVSNSVSVEMIQEIRRSLRPSIWSIVETDTTSAPSARTAKSMTHASMRSRTSTTAIPSSGRSPLPARNWRIASMERAKDA